MKVMKRYGKRCVAYFSIIVIALLGTGSLWGKPTIKFADQQYASLSICNAIAQFIVQHGYGYKTEIRVVSTADLKKMLPSGGIDIMMEGWEHNKLEWYNEQLNKGTIENLGPTFESGPQFFIIPKWMAYKYNIKTVADIKKHWKLVKDHNDLSRGVFLNCPSGSSCGKINGIKLEAYGMYKTFNLRAAKSYDAMEAALVEAQKKRMPIFSYYWKPSTIMGMYDWYILEEPPYNDKIWKKVKDATEDKIRRPIDKACAYPDPPINKLVSSGLKKKAPEVVAMLKKMNIGLERLTKMMVWAKKNKVKDYNKIALHFFREYDVEWGRWMPDEPYIKTRKAVQKEFGF